MNLSWKFWIPSLLLLSLLMSACEGETRRDLPDLSGIVVEPVFRHFDRDLFGLDTTRMLEELQTLEANYPDFAPIYFDYILRSRNPTVSPEQHADFIRGFVGFPEVRQLYDTCQLVFGDWQPFADRFTEAFRYLTYYFPDLPTPDVTTFVSEYSMANFIYKEQSLAVGLDFFLGDDYPYQLLNPGNPAFSRYLTRSFNADHLVAKTLQPLVEDLSGPAPGDKLLDIMVHNGKRLYLLDALLPLTPDSVKLEVSQDQVAWLNENALQMWAFFLEEELLYSADWQKIRKYVDYSPNSPGMPDEAPGRTANWLGWQIVKQYMSRFPETSMQELIGLSDAQELLLKSRYKPAR